MSQDDLAAGPVEESEGSPLSRRRMLAGAGATALGAGLATGLLGSAAASADTGVGSAGIGLGPSGTSSTELRGRIRQTGASGEQFECVGFVTRANGLDPAALAQGSPLSVGTALFTVYAKGELVSRVLDTSVHALDIVGTMSVYQRSAPGAGFGDSSSFRVGAVVASFDLQLQDVLTVFAPGKGIPTLTGDMRQLTAARVAGTNSQFGRQNAQLRLFATGIGTLTDPVTLNAELEIAGHWVTV